MYKKKEKKPTKIKLHNTHKYRLIFRVSRDIMNMIYYGCSEIIGGISL